MRALLLILVCPLLIAAQTITVTPGTSFQTINGWDADFQAGQFDFPSNFAVYGSTLLDQVVEMGINRITIGVDGDYENPTARPTHVAINDNADPFVYNAAGFNWGELDGNMNLIIMPMRTRLAAQGETLWITLTYSDFLNFFHKDNADEYSELILATFNRMQANWGVVPDALEVILEPDNSGNSNWTATKIANCLAATQTRLAAAGYNPRFIIPSVQRCPDAGTWYGNVKTANSSVIQYVDEVSYHRYDPCSSGQLNTLRDLAAVDGNRLSMLEYWDAGSSYTVLHEDIGPNGNGVAWEGGTIAYPNHADTFGIYFLVNSSTNAVSMASKTKFYRQYMKWIRRGAVRKATSTSNSNFDGLAFRNTGGNYTVAVNCLTSGSFTIGGLPADTYHVTYTTASAYNQNAADQTITAGQNISTSIPAAGVLTVHADAPASAVPGAASRGRIGGRGKTKAH